jgi:FtsH-binding integral membrane protein
MNKERAREFLIKSKLYRFLALVFACVGVVVFIGLYAQQSKQDGGGFLDILRDPVLIVLMIFPFVPAIVLSLMARRSERKLAEILKEP